MASDMALVAVIAALIASPEVPDSASDRAAVSATVGKSASVADSLMVRLKVVTPEDCCGSPNGSVPNAALPKLIYTTGQPELKS
jgi:hypothetical protein